MTKISKLLVACFFAYLLAQLLFRVYDADTWFHLNVGRYVAQHHALPSVNLFSFTEPNQPWMPHEWLAGAVFYGAFALLGAKGLLLVRVLVYLGVFILLFRLVHAPGYEIVNVMGLMATIGVILSRLVDRPEMFSALFLVSYFYLLEKWRQDELDTRWLWLIPALQALWINTHGYSLLGLIFLGVYWVGEFGIAEGFSLKSRRSKELARVAAASVAACLVNPHFHQGLIRLLSVAGNIADRRIIEWQRPYEDFASFWRTPWGEAEKRLIWIPALFLILNFRKSRLTHWLLYGTFLLAFLNAGRNILFLALVAIPIMLINLRAAADGLAAKTLHPKIKAALAPALGLGLACLLACGVYDMATGRYYARHGIVREWGPGLSLVFPPAEACDFIERAGLEGPAYNNYGIGNYLMWRFPERKVFLDGRNNEAYSSEFLSYTHRVSNGEIPIAELTRRHPIRFFLISHTYPDTNTTALIKTLYRDARWQLAYADHTSVIFVPRETAKGLFIKGSDDIPVTFANKWSLVWRHYQLASLAIELGWKDLAAAENLKALELEPGLIPLRRQFEALQKMSERAPAGART